MDDLKSLITVNDNWTNAEGENDGEPFLLRFRPTYKISLTQINTTKDLPFCGIMPLIIVP